MKKSNERRALGIIAMLTCLWLAPAAFGQDFASEGQGLEESTAPPPGFEQVTGPGTGHEEVAAAPLVIAAYGLIWALLLMYLGTLWLRQRRLQAEMRALQDRLAS